MLPGPPNPGQAPTPHTTPPALRLAELVAAFSLVADLAMGHPSDEAMRACLLATALARRLGRPEDEVADIYWTTLLAHSGCTAFAHEQAALLGGDEIAVNAAGSKADFGEPREVFLFLREVVRGRTMVDGLRIVIGGMSAGKRFDQQLATANCEIAATVAHRLALAPAVGEALLQMFERWDGGGVPRGQRAEEIQPAARFAQLAHQTAVFARLGGPGEALDVAKRRAGKALDPDLVRAFEVHGEELIAGFDGLDPYNEVLAMEPAPELHIPAERLGEVAEVFGDVVDLKTPLLMGHARGVAALAAAGAAELGMTSQDIEQLRLAALLHDLGRASVPNRIWEKPSSLTQAQWEMVRLHAYHSERILLRSRVLAPLAPIAGTHHERLDGSGYHRQLAGPDLTLPARVLAAADAFVAMTQPRRHRAAFSADVTASHLLEEAHAGRLDAGAVDAVLAGAGARARAGRPRQPGDLTEREAEVLCLIARGASNHEVARRLSIAPKTVGSHVEHIYAKLGIRSRAAAALYAARSGLID